MPCDLQSILLSPALQLRVNMLPAAFSGTSPGGCYSISLPLTLKSQKTGSVSLGSPFLKQPCPGSCPHPQSLPQISQSVPFPSEPGPPGVTHTQMHSCTPHPPQRLPPFGAETKPREKRKVQRKRLESIFHILPGSMNCRVITQM